MEVNRPQGWTYMAKEKATLAQSSTISIQSTSFMLEHGWKKLQKCHCGAQFESAMALWPSGKPKQPLTIYAPASASGTTYRLICTICWCLTCEINISCCGSWEVEVLHFLTDVRVFRATSYTTSINDIFVAFQDHTNTEIIKPFTETFKCIHSELALCRCSGPQSEDVAVMWSQITEISSISLGVTKRKRPLTVTSSRWSATKWLACPC